METLEKINLAQRTRLRNDSLWITLDWGGLMNPLATQQAIMDVLAQPGIENFMAISDENWGIKEFQRDRSYGLDQAEITQQRQIIDDDITTKREKLAIQRVTDEYTLAVRVYDAKVKALLMGAREYVAQVELEQLAVEVSRTVLAVEKEALHLKEVNAKIYYEYIQRAMVEADIAKSQVEVAKAHVRAIMADIEAGEADIKVIEAQTQQYIAQADKVGLQADVAMIYAEILTKKLSSVKLDVGQKEIAAGFGYIQSRLDDALVKLETQKIEEALKTEFEVTALEEANLILKDEEASEDLRETEMVDAREVLTYTKDQTAQNIQDETTLKQRVVAIREALSDQRRSTTEQKDTKQTWAEKLLNDAKAATYMRQARTSISAQRITETISKGT